MHFTIFTSTLEDSGAIFVSAGEKSQPFCVNSSAFSSFCAVSRQNDSPVARACQKRIPLNREGDAALKRIALLALASVFPFVVPAAEPLIEIRSPMPPPQWALLEREVLRAGSQAVNEFYSNYFDERGYLRHVARWGILDGTDDAIETFHNWTLFHALGAEDLVLDRYHQALEGHLRQYTDVKTVTTDIAKNGVYYREFYRHTDWLHAGEGLRSFFFQGLSDPAEALYIDRMRRFAGLYMNEDPEALNYDPEHRIIRSTLNGSNGPLLRNLTPQDWIGDPTPGRFHLLHSEKGSTEMLDFEAEYPSMLAHIDDPVYDCAAGDNPLNLATTNLATAAYLLTGEAKYRDWVLEYAGAWRERTEANGGIIPGNIGLDGVIGSAYSGKWYKGVFMWDRDHYEGSLASWGMWPGFGNAYLLTGDKRWIDTLRRQIDVIYAQGHEMNSRFMVPNNYGDNGWYHLREYTFTDELAKIWVVDPGPRRPGAPAATGLDRLSRRRQSHIPRDCSPAGTGIYPRQRRPHAPRSDNARHPARRLGHAEQPGHNAGPGRADLRRAPHRQGFGPHVWAPSRPRALLRSGEAARRSARGCGGACNLHGPTNGAAHRGECQPSESPVGDRARRRLRGTPHP